VSHPANVLGKQWNFGLENELVSRFWSTGMTYVDTTHAKTSQFVFFCRASSFSPLSLLISWSSPQPFSTCPFSSLHCLFVYFGPYYFVAFFRPFSFKLLLFFSSFVLSFLRIELLIHLDEDCLFEISIMVSIICSVAFLLFPSLIASHLLFVLS